jgi:adenosylcobinamide-phosphate synthase
MIQPSVLFCACALDLLIGDPRRLPHPVRLIGSAISAGEPLARRFGRSPSREFIAGAGLSASLVVVSYLSARASIRLARKVHSVFGLIAEVTMACTALAVRSLDSEARSVVVALEAGELTLARHRLSRIVGRDTEYLDQSEIARAVIETLAESTCDGVIAPLFYLAIGGVPLAFAYKTVNTLDSMIGHKEPPYAYFGRFAARADDAANFLPARITALAIGLAASILGADVQAAWRVWRRDGRKHPSPNAGQSEAAMAGALHVRLGGMNFYDGEPHNKPHLGAEYENPTTGHARKALGIALAASVAGCVAAVVVSWLGNKVTRSGR